MFHLFRRCREVSFKEVTDMLLVGQKTACLETAALSERPDDWEEARV